MSETSSHYIHGTAPDEQQRLSLLNQILNDGSLRELVLHGGERILDLGCGLGQLTRSMARAAGPGARVVGIERSPEQLAEATRQAREAGEEGLVEFRRGDVLALSLGPDEWGTFDVAHARYVLEHVNDPLAVVRAMVRAVRPGGRVVLEDDDHDVLRLWPESPGFTHVWQAYCRTYDRIGNDPYVGRHLVALLSEAGAAPRRNTGIWFGACAGDPVFPLWVTNLVELLIGARETVVAGGMLDRPSFDATIDALRDWGRRPDASSWYSMYWAEGIRPLDDTQPAGS